MRAAACENTVPNSIIAVGAQYARAFRRNARRRYWPARPGINANAWVEPSSARSFPMTAARRWNDATAGRTQSVARPFTAAFTVRRRTAFGDGAADLAGTAMRLSNDERERPGHVVGRRHHEGLSQL